MTSVQRNDGQKRAVFLRHGRVVMAGTALALVALCGLVPGHNMALAAEPSGYEILPTLGGFSNNAFAVSGDGRVVVGSSSPDAVVWRLGGGIQTIPTPNAASAQANATNADGSVTVGSYRIDISEIHAFRWTEAGMVELLGLGGNTSALGVSADGSVVVGTSGGYAARWDGTSFTQLDSLGGTYNVAYAVSDDGLVAVGASSYSGNSARAVRWVGTDIFELGPPGMGYTEARGVNADGSVIVGYGQLNGNVNNTAFRWTADTDQMLSLGTLGGDRSEAHDVSADGSVVVGYSEIVTSGINRAFRWTVLTGMVSVEDWLRANGVTVQNDFTEVAYGVSDDGNVVVGRTDSLRPFIARVSDYGSGIIDVEQYMQTLAGRPSSTQIGLGIAGTTMNGAHGEPMRNLLDVGRQSLQITTDAGYDNGRRSDGGVVISDFTYGLGLEGGITARLSAGGLYTKQDMDAGGDFKYHGFHIAPEVTLPVLDGLYATLGGYYSSGQIDINRGYLNGGVMDYSRGDADFDTWGAKLRFDWLNAFKANDWNFTPYTSLTYANARMDGYDEQGGGFASSFNSVRDHSTVLRLGLDAVSDITERVRLLGKVEADYRFENKTADVSGTIGGLSGFTLAGQDVDQFWLRGGFGAEFDTKAGTAFISLNASTQGDDPTVWVKSGWKVVF